MASVWIKTRQTNDGATRYRVEYRPGGREEPVRYGGSFKTKREALLRKAWIAGELAALRIPDLRQLKQQAPAPTVADACERWLASRIDVAASTRTEQRVLLNRVLPILGRKRVDEVTPADVADLIATFDASGLKRGTIRKSLIALAQVLDYCGLTGERNAARDRVTVRLPREEHDEIQPPTAGHVEAVLRVLPRRYRLPTLVLEATGMRVGEMQALTWGDVDERNEQWRVTRSTSKTGRGRWVPVDGILFDAVMRLRARDDRDPQAQVFDEFGAARLREALRRACIATGTPLFSPHDLRHRRISLWHRLGIPWAEIGKWVGQRSLSVTADTYTHVLVDDAELDRFALVADVV